MKACTLMILLLTSCSTVAQEFYRVPQISLTNKFLLESLDDYLREYSDDLDQMGVIVLTYDPQNKCYYLTHKMFRTEVEKWLPSFYTIYNKRIVLVYTGFESELNFDALSGKELLKNAEEFFEDPRAMLYHADIWKITFESDRYKKEQVDRIPLDY